MPSLKQQTGKNKQKYENYIPAFPKVPVTFLYDTVSSHWIYEQGKKEVTKSLRHGHHKRKLVNLFPPAIIEISKFAVRFCTEITAIRE